MWKYEKQFRAEKPETINESDRHFDLDNYKDWLEEKLSVSIDTVKDSLTHIADFKLGNSAPFPLRSFEDECMELIKSLES